MLERALRWPLQSARQLLALYCFSLHKQESNGLEGGKVWLMEKLDSPKSAAIKHSFSQAIKTAEDLLE